MYFGNFNFLFLEPLILDTSGVILILIGRINMIGFSNNKINYCVRRRSFLVNFVNYEEKKKVFG